MRDAGLGCQSSPRAVRIRPRRPDQLEAADLIPIFFQCPTLGSGAVIASTPGSHIGPGGKLQNEPGPWFNGTSVTSVISAPLLLYGAADRVSFVQSVYLVDLLTRGTPSNEIGRVSVPRVM